MGDSGARRGGRLAIAEVPLIARDAVTIAVARSGCVERDGLVSAGRRWAERERGGGRRVGCEHAYRASHCRPVDQTVVVVDAR